VSPNMLKPCCSSRAIDAIERIEQGQPAHCRPARPKQSTPPATIHAVCQARLVPINNMVKMDVGNDVGGELNLKSRPARADAQHKQGGSEQISVGIGLKALTPLRETFPMPEQQAGKYQRHRQGQAIQVEIVEAAPVRCEIACVARRGKVSAQRSFFGRVSGAGEQNSSPAAINGLAARAD